MEIYAVGGAVRDELLGVPVSDRDYVVVGATPEQMVALGYRPVGRDFPVFLHPRTHEEYALARTERKIARGYRGFAISASPEVTLEQDLARRDLTINAIARDARGRLVDPYGGAGDLRAGVLRHVSDAFAEDPVRILRVARFAARFGFTVAPQTMALMQRMVREGEADALVPERVWQELSRGLMERSPSRLFAVLAECGALARLLPELALSFAPLRAPGGARDAPPDAGASAFGPANDAARVVTRALECRSLPALRLPERFAVLCWGLRGLPHAPAQLRAVCGRLKPPAECGELASLALRFGAAIRRAPLATPGELLALIERCDALRRPARMEALLRVCHAESCGERGWAEVPFPPAQRLRGGLAAAAAVDAGAIARRGTGRGIAQRVRAARLRALAALPAQATRA